MGMTEMWKTFQAGDKASVTEIGIYGVDLVGVGWTTYNRKSGVLFFWY